MEESRKGAKKRLICEDKIVRCEILELAESVTLDICRSFQDPSDPAIAVHKTPPIQKLIAGLLGKFGSVVEGAKPRVAVLNPVNDKLIRVCR